MNTTTTTTTEPRTDGLGVAGMVCGICGIFMGWMYLVLPILGIVFGGVAISRINKGTRSGRGMAQAGLVTGIIGLAIWLGIFVLLIAAAP